MSPSFQARVKNAKEKTIGTHPFTAKSWDEAKTIATKWANIGDGKASGTWSTCGARCWQRPYDMGKFESAILYLRRV
jgi:hypothetical protein